MRKYVDIDKSEYPIIKVTYQPFTPTLEEFAEMQNDLYQLMQTTEYFNLVDLTHMNFLTSEMRIKQGEWAKKHDQLIKQKVKAMAFVVPSLISSMMLKGVFVIFKPSTPYVIVKNIEEGTKWLEDKLQEKAA